MAKQVSDERKTLYIIGLVMTIIGGLVFVYGMYSNVAGFSDGKASMSSYATTLFIGMGLMIVGEFVRRLAARGVAGSGLILDPDRARSELEPYSRMAGGMVKDALEETDLKVGSQPEKVIMIKCPACAKLNEEDSKYCQECGCRI